jgi:threonine/homoserine/homoserine lactone efflux protein
VLPAHHLIPFLVTVYVVILIPGPSVLFVVSRGLALGRRAALATVVGNSAGFACQLVLAAVGLGAVIARSDAVFEVLKLVGAAYLVLLGVRKIRDRRSLGTALGSATAGGPKSLRTTLREGFVVGVTNPKGILIFTAILPQFVDRSGASATAQLLALGVICIAIALLSDSMWALGSGTARVWLGRSPRRLEGLSTAGGVMLIGLGVGLAVTGRRP